LSYGRSAPATWKP